jgi:diaminopimelate decarboxylase
MFPTASTLISARPSLHMDSLSGRMFEDAVLHDIARTYGTPVWVYGAATLQARVLVLQRSFAGVAIHYALKANDHLALLKILSTEGLGADIVSGGEMLRAQRGGFAPAKIVFSGVGKSADELSAAIGNKLGQINVESAEELDMLAGIATQLGVRVPVALRVNPEVDAQTHEKISTGRKGDKFGIPIGDIAALYARGATLPGIDLRGLAVHIGSQVFAMAPYRAAYEKVAHLIGQLRDQGLAVHSMDCGGGLAVPYRNEPAPLPEAWAATVRAAFGDMGLDLAIEPGRWIAAPAGILLSRVIRTRREGMVRPLHIIDAAMNELARPAMYDAWHGVVPVSPVALHKPAEPADVAGPVCESSDFLARDRLLPPLQAGDLVAILDVGAYGAVMSSTYNARPAAAQMLVQGGTAMLIRPRGRPEDLWRDEIMPGDIEATREATA